MKRITTYILLLLVAMAVQAQINTDQVMRIGRNSLYFEDYIGSVAATGAFALVANAVTIWQAVYDKTAYFGTGFMAGAVVYFAIAIVRLEWSTRRLPYLLLGRQAAATGAGMGEGIFTRLENRLTRIDKRASGRLAARIAVPADGKKRAVRPRRR